MVTFEALYLVILAQLRYFWREEQDDSADCELDGTSDEGRKDWFALPKKVRNAV